MEHALHLANVPAKVELPVATVQLGRYSFLLFESSIKSTNQKALRIECFSGSEFVVSSSSLHQGQQSTRIVLTSEIRVFQVLTQAPGRFHIQ